LEGFWIFVVVAWVRKDGKQKKKCMMVGMVHWKNNYLLLLKTYSIAKV
jgi:hypothetical protein